MLQQTINDRWKAAFKNKDDVLKSAFAMIKAKILVEEKSGKYELPLADSVIEGLIQKEVKELKETQSYYKSDDDMYIEVERKIQALSEYLPKQLSEEDVKLIIKKLSLNETNKGKLTGMVVREVGSRFDKSKIAKLVSEVLA